MLTSLSLENYRCFDKQVDVPLQSITVLFGPNASGKTAILDALNQVATIAAGNRRRYEDVFKASGPYSMRQQAADTSRPTQFQLTYEHSFPTGPSQLQYLLSISAKGQGVEGTEVLQIDGKMLHSGTGTTSALSHLQLNDVDDQDVLSGFLRQIQFMRRYRIAPDKARDQTDSATHWIAPTGQDLPAALDYEFQNDPGSQAAYVQNVRELFPSIDDISIGLGGSGTSWVEIRTVDGRRHIGAHLSDGQAVCLTVLFLLLSKRGPKVLCFEEIENGLSPRLIRQLLDQVRRSVESQAVVSQVIATSHSPFVISWADEYGLALQVSPTAGVRPITEVLHQHGAARDQPVTYSEACGLLETYWYS